jgi:transposase, IS30 family
VAAHHKAYVRRKYAKYQGQHIRLVPELENYIIAELKKGHSPKAISGRMRRLQLPWYASKTAIYDWLYSVWGQPYCHYLFSRQWRKKRRKGKKVSRTLIPQRTSIHQRPELKGYGHYEADTIMSGRHTGSTYALVTLTNIKLGYIDARRVPNLKPITVLEALRSMFQVIRKPTSLTFDNGQENRLHIQLKVPTFFCDPYSSWQKPQVENANKLIRRFIPKGVDIRQYSHQFVHNMVVKLNDMPKEKLGWLTANEVMCEHKLFRKTKTHHHEGGALGG